MRLVISASIGKLPQPDMCVRAAQESFTYLERVALLRQRLGRRFSEISDDMDDPLGATMVQSVRTVGDEDLTPMAAVAGTIGDAVADYLFHRGMTKVIVDNGGDVAVRLLGGEPTTVGVRSEIGKKDVSHVIALDSSNPSWGVATSGLGGRSLTRGVASATTVIAHSASLADAAATAIANASFVENDHVVQRFAEEIDPNTDISGLPVTLKVGPLSEEKKSIALSMAMKRAEQLSRGRVILGAFVAVQGSIAMSDFFRERLID